MKLLSGLVLALVVAVISAEKMRFDNHKIYKVNVENEEQLKVLRQLEETPEGEYTFFDSPRVGQSVDVVVPPHRLYEFGGLTKQLKIDNELKVENLQTLIDAETPVVQPSAIGWTAYYNYTEIYDWLDELLLTYPTILTGYVVGETYQGRPIRAVRLSRQQGNPTIFIEANIHAREWITSASATWLLNELLTSSDPVMVDLSQNIDWYIIPVFNVDGFHYTKTTNRLWRKTRQNHATICFGTDANRNFDFHWLENDGASSNPCSDTYAGPVPFSEPETAALRNFLEPIGSKINIYLSFHSYGPYILFPYGHSRTELTEHHEVLDEIGNIAAEGFAQYNNTRYVVGTAAAALYVATGTSVDWAFNEYDLTLSYTFEFIGLGYGFVLPPEYILRNCYELRDGLVAMITRARELGHMNVRP